jgi:hypothetical protein
MSKSSGRFSGEQSASPLIFMMTRLYFGSINIPSISQSLYQSNAARATAIIQAEPEENTFAGHIIDHTPQTTEIEISKTIWQSSNWCAYVIR